MNKRIVAAGAAIGLALGAGSALAQTNAAGNIQLDTTTVANTATNTQQQQQQNNPWALQYQPQAGALADASANSANGVGTGNGGVIANVGEENGNTEIDSNTEGGTAVAIAANVNLVDAPQTQSNNQEIDQTTRIRTAKLAVLGSDNEVEL